VIRQRQSPQCSLADLLDGVPLRSAQHHDPPALQVNGAMVCAFI
jgi:hypothetical protein